MLGGRGFSVIALAFACAAAAASLALLAGSASATDLSGALITSADCTQNALARNDDGSTSAVALPFPIEFFGRRYERLWVNNNGNVTFDGPLSTYTPFGLSGTSAVIIAPFFADVDTRASGSDLVRYGWGETTYQGHRAFCVNWINVGYYSFHTDKLNSFQLLLVEREDSAAGDFDIVFNYGSIRWETGDASGGVGGFGGFPAHVGYSNGDAQAGTSFELAGSGRSGAFIDGNAEFGLIDQSFGSTQRGRYVFPVRNGAPLPDEYVAMGDSYQAGVGSGDYDPATNVGGTNECLRSPNAYAPRLVADGSIPLELDFVACSGARIEHLYQSGPVTSGPPWNEDAQISHLSERTALVTVGIGGNNLNFGPLIQDCITQHFVFSSCEDAYDDDVLDALLALLDHGPGGLNRLQELYLDIRFRAWRGHWLVLGYPRFFGLDGGWDWWSSGLLVPRCNNIRVSDQLWVNHKVRQLNQAIRASAQSMGLQYVDIEDAPQGHELCEGDPGFLNGIVPFHLVDSFHPSAYGYSVIADVLRGVLPPFAGSGGAGGGGGGGAGLTMSAAQQSETFTVHPGETVTATRTIAGGTQVSFSTSWPGSDVAMTLRSPSGRVIDRATSAADLHHRVGPTQELYLVTDPEPGTWTIELYGANVQPAGEPTTLAVYETPRPNADPVASFTSSQRGRTLTLDATGSTDSDGQVVAYLWEFGDGTFATGARVTHTYAQPGTYRVTLVVADDDEGLGFAAGDQDIVVPTYEFGGFREPVEDQPALNDRNAGSAVPVKFTLANAEGVDIFGADFPQSQPIDCDTRQPLGAGEPMTEGEWTFVELEAGVYHFNWKTNKQWEDTCRRLVLGFDDGSRAAADFWFK
jgi:hypothetical protein